MNTKNVRWILNCSCSDLNYIGAIPKLTNEELIYCIEKETRKTGLKRLQGEAKNRGIAMKVSIK